MGQENKSGEYAAVSDLCCDLGVSAICLNPHSFLDKSDEIIYDNEGTTDHLYWLNSGILLKNLQENGVFTRIIYEGGYGNDTVVGGRSLSG